MQHSSAGQHEQPLHLVEVLGISSSVTHCDAGNACTSLTWLPVRRGVRQAWDVSGHAGASPEGIGTAQFVGVRPEEKSGREAHQSRVALESRGSTPPLLRVIAASVSSRQVRHAVGHYREHTECSTSSFRTTHLRRADPCHTWQSGSGSASPGSAMASAASINGCCAWSRRQRRALNFGDPPRPRLCHHSLRHKDTGEGSSLVRVAATSTQTVKWGVRQTERVQALDTPYTSLIGPNRKC
jgi:hypothetical protein